MPTLPIDSNFYVRSDAEGGFRNGEIFHSERTVQGGSIATPVGCYFTTKPDIPEEGFNPHSRIDCFLWDHELTPAEDWLTRRLVDALLLSAVVAEPLWVSWHRAKELGGEARGEVYNFD